jgi:hypothetical protein
VKVQNEPRSLIYINDLKLMNHEGQIICKNADLTFVVFYFGKKIQIKTLKMLKGRKIEQPKGRAFLWI